MNKRRTIPKWVEDVAPREIVESTIFKFRINTRSIDRFKCLSCVSEYQANVPLCPKCNSDKRKPIYKIVEVDSLPNFNLDYDNVEYEIEDLPAQIAYYSMLYSEAKLRSNHLERLVKVRKAEATKLLRSKGSEGGVKFTADVVKQLIESDDGVISSDFELAQAQMQAGKLFGIVEALKAKADLARSLYAVKKKEI